MKGIMAETLSNKEAKEKSKFKYRLKVEHLKFWFLQPMPTYLALYIESLDRFLILNLQKYIQEKWGRGILSLDQETAEVEVSASSVLDREALNIILREGTVEEWIKALSADEDHIRLCERDYNIIWRIGTAEGRNVEHRFEIFDWQSKLRGEVHIQERTRDDKAEWTMVRNHWQLQLGGVHGAEEMYPYLDLTAAEEGEDYSYDVVDELDEYGDRNYLEDEREYRPTSKMKNGQIAAGEDCSGEYHLYYIIPELNDLGRNLFKLIETLVDIKFIEIKDDEGGEWMSVAPWHARQV